MKILVTGGAGFIGSNILKEICRRGDEPVCLDDFTHANYKNIVELDCELIPGDITDKEIFRHLPEVDAVIHEAAITDTTLKDNSKMMMVNTQGFINVLEFCAKNKIPLVYASSAGVYGDGPSPMKESQSPRPLNTYAFSKLACDRIMLKKIKDLGLPYIAGLRYFNVYGPGEFHKGRSSSMIYQLFCQMKEGKRPKIFKYGEQKRDFIFVKDVVAATLKALDTEKSGIFNVGTGIARSFNDIINIINKNLGTNLEPDYIDNPYQGLYQDFTEAEMSFTKKELNFSAKYSLEEGIKEYIEFLITNERGGDEEDKP